MRDWGHPPSRLEVGGCRSLPNMAPAWGTGMTSVIGPVGLLVVLLVGGCAAEGKSRARGAVCVSEYVASPGLLVLPSGALRPRDSEVNNDDGINKAVTVMMTSASPASTLHQTQC